MYKVRRGRASGRDTGRDAGVSGVLSEITKINKKYYTHTCFTSNENYHTHTRALLLLVRSNCAAIFLTRKQLIDTFTFMSEGVRQKCESVPRRARI